MNSVLKILESRGLCSAESVERLFNEWPFEQVLDVQEELDAALGTGQASRGDTPPVGDPFNFIASASMRGDFGCISWECRLKKIDLLARYAALYADKVIVPLPLGTLRDEEDEYHTRQLFAGTILCIQHLRPLVDGGIVDFARQEFQYCNEHLQLALPQHSRIAASARQLYLRNRDRFQVFEEPPDDEEDESPSFKIKGPSEFLEHGRLWKTLYEIPEWLIGWRQLKRRKRLSDELVQKSHMVEEIFDDLARDVAIQQVLGIKYNAKYLTNLPGEALVLSKFTSDDSYYRHCSDVLCAQLTHAVPLLQDTPLPVVMRIRKSEPDAFMQYRTAIRKIVHDYIKKRKVVGQKEAREIYSDLLLPELTKLNSEARSVRKAALKKASAKTLIAAGVIGIGVFGSLLPSQLSDLLKAIGALGLLRELGEAFSSIERNPTQVRNSNLYFLLRLNQEARH